MVTTAGTKQQDATISAENILVNGYIRGFQVGCDVIGIPPWHRTPATEPYHTQQLVFQNQT